MYFFLPKNDFSDITIIIGNFNIYWCYSYCVGHMPKKKPSRIVSLVRDSIRLIVFPHSFKAPPAQSLALSNKQISKGKSG